MFREEKIDKGTAQSEKKRKTEGKSSVRGREEGEVVITVNKNIQELCLSGY